MPAGCSEVWTWARQLPQGQHRWESLLLPGWFICGFKCDSAEFFITRFTNRLSRTSWTPHAPEPLPRVSSSWAPVEGCQARFRNSRASTPSPTCLQGPHRLPEAGSARARRDPKLPRDKQLLRPPHLAIDGFIQHQICPAATIILLPVPARTRRAPSRAFPCLGVPRRHHLPQARRPLPSLASSLDCFSVTARASSRNPHPVWRRRR